MSERNRKEKYKWRPQTLDQMIDGFSNGKISSDSLPDFVAILEAQRHRLSAEQLAKVKHLLYSDQAGSNPSHTTVTLQEPYCADSLYGFYSLEELFAELERLNQCQSETEPGQSLVHRMSERLAVLLKVLLPDLRSPQFESLPDEELLTRLQKYRRNKGQLRLGLEGM